MKLILGDSLDKLKGLEDNSVDSIVTDPPYHLVSIVKRFGKENSAPAKYGKDGSFGRLSKGFMGKQWDGLDENGIGIAQNVELWEECLRVLKPGGHLLAFSGTRTYHRMACAIEDAGFEVRDMIEWVYGSGFSKCTVWKEGAKRSSESLNRENDLMVENNWNGWGRGGLKPSHEPICMARKPISEKTVAENVLKYGTGGINIDESRVDVADSEKIKQEGHIRKNNVVGDNRTSIAAGQFGDGAFVAGTDLTNGRFPANLIHDGSDEVVGLFPNSKSAGEYKKDKLNTFKPEKAMFALGYQTNSYAGETGSASRFFYCAKASKSERNKGVDSIVSIMIEYNIWKDINTTQQVKKVQLLVDMDKSAQKVIGVSGTESKNATEWNTMLFGNCTMEQFQKINKSITKTTTNLITTSTILNWLTHLLTNDYTADVNYETENGGNLVENVANYNTLTTTINEKMVSALGVNNVVLGTQLKISVKEGSNIHSTVKPISLMRYLCKLVTPKGGTVLDPFMGSGTTGIGAKLEGFDFIGIEREEEYIKIAEARINAWQKENKLL